MNTVRIKYPRRYTLGLIFGAFTAYILFCALQSTFRNLHSSQLKPWSETITLQIVWGYTWALLTPLIIWGANRFALSRQNLTRNLLLQICFGIVFAFAHRVIYHMVVPLISPTALMIPDPGLSRIFYFLYFISESFLDYLFILAIYHAFRLKLLFYFSIINQSASVKDGLNVSINVFYLGKFRETCN